MGGSISKPSASRAIMVPQDVDLPEAGAPARGRRPAAAPRRVRFSLEATGSERAGVKPVSGREVESAGSGRTAADTKAAMLGRGESSAQMGHPGSPRLAANLKALVVSLHEQEFAEMIDLAKEVASACQRDGVATDAQALAEALRFLLEDPMLDEMQLQSAGRGLLAAALPGGRKERSNMILIANFLAAPGRSAELAPRIAALSEALAARSEPPHD